MEAAPFFPSRVPLESPARPALPGSGPSGAFPWAVRESGHTLKAPPPRRSPVTGPTPPRRRGHHARPRPPPAVPAPPASSGDPGPQAPLRLGGSPVLPTPQEGRARGERSPHQTLNVGPVCFLKPSGVPLPYRTLGLPVPSYLPRPNAHPLSLDDSHALQRDPPSPVWCPPGYLFPTKCKMQLGPRRLLSPPASASRSPRHAPPSRRLPAVSSHLGLFLVTKALLLLFSPC